MANLVRKRGFKENTACLSAGFLLWAVINLTYFVFGH